MSGKIKDRDFTAGSMPGLIIRQALPLTVSQFVQLLYNIVDRMYIGHLPGDDIAPLTGLGLTLPVVSAISAFTLLLGQGGAPHFSIRRGRGERDTAASILGNSFTLLLISSLILTLTGCLFMRQILFLTGATESSYVFASDYLKIYLAGTVFSMLSAGLNFYISAEGFPKTAMFTVLSGAVLNMILDPVFIFGLGLGIKGAAAASVISQAVSCIWVLCFLFVKAPIPITPSCMRLKPGIVRMIVTMGFTGFIMEFTNMGALVVCNRTLRSRGGDMADIYISIMTIVMSVRSFISVAVNGITSGATPVIGYNYGAERYDRVRTGIKCTSLFAFAYTGLAWLLIFIFPSFFIGLFSEHPELNTVAVPYLHIYFMAYIFMSLQYSGQSTFMALGKAGRAITFSLFRKAVLVIPLTMILPMFLPDPISGVFWAEPVSNIIGGSASFLAMYLTVYRKLPHESKTLKI